MSVNGQIMQQQQQQIQQLQQELQNELTSSNQLLRLISIELQKIKQITACGGEIERSIVQNATLVEKLANTQQIDLKKLPETEGICNSHSKMIEE
ncbi:unnamed protein product, partial [Iphiclides podalirius]